MRARLRAEAEHIFRAAVAAVDPSRLVRERLTSARGLLEIDLGDRVLRRRSSRIWVAAVGKAAAAMVLGLRAVLPDAPAALILPPKSSLSWRTREWTRIWRGDHPVPGPASFRATAGLLRLLRSQPRETVVIFLLSGGASALLAAPAVGLRPADEIALGRWLLRSGLPIDAMNTIRKHTSAVKGGGFLLQAAPREVVTLVLSDVPGDDLSTIGSGPTVADPSTFADALRAVDRAIGGARFPARVRRHLEAGADGRQAETIKPGDPRLARSHVALVGSNATALRAAAHRARSLGYAVRYGAALEGEARDCATRLVASLPRAPERPLCVLSGGETTVAVRGGTGRGGRSQELALAAAAKLPAGWVLLAAGTDGIDGRTPVAGAFADSSVRRLGRSAIAAALREHDSYRLLASGGHVLHTGSTGTNVGDLVIALHMGG